MPKHNYVLSRLNRRCIDSSQMGPSDFFDVPTPSRPFRVERSWVVLGFHPQRSDERFQICFLTSHPPFPSFLAQLDKLQRVYACRI